MALALAIAAVVFSLVAALFAGLTFLRTKNGREPVFNSENDLGGIIRTEADRIRQAAEMQAQNLRQELAETIERFRNGLAGDIDRMGKEATQNRDTLRQTIEGKLDAAELKSTNSARDLRVELIDNFGKTSDVLSKSLKDFGEGQSQRLESIKKEVADMSDRQATAGEQLRKTVEERLDVLRQENSAKLDEMRQTVDEKLQTTLEKRLSESFTLVQTQLENVHKGLGEMQSLATGVGDLKRVLTNVKTRGTWGEVQLGMLLEQFLLPDQYLKNAQVKESSLERVEYAVRFPGRDGEKEVLLPIDAKFPQEDYERLVHAAERADTTAVEEAAAALEVRVKNFAKAISEKYVNTPTTTDFAILFLPTESLFAEVLRRPGLFEQLQRDCRVTLAGPTTLSAMLSAFQLGFQSLAIQKRSSEVRQILAAVKTEFSQHGKVVDTLKRHLNAATNTIDKLGTRTRAMNRSLRNVESLPGSQAEALLQFPDEPEEEFEDMADSPPQQDHA